MGILPTITAGVLSGVFVPGGLSQELPARNPAVSPASSILLDGLTGAFRPGAPGILLAAGGVLPATEGEPAFGELILTGWNRGPVAPSGSASRESMSPVFDDRSWPTTHSFDEVQVPPNSTVVFRKHLFLDTAQQAKMKKARIKLSPIDDEGVITVNGWKVGESKNYNQSFEYSLNSLLRVGDNVIVVVVTNGGTLGHMAREVKIVP